MALRTETNRTIRHAGNRNRNKGKNEPDNDAEFVGIGLNAALKCGPALTVGAHKITMKKITALKTLLKSDPRAADLKWSLFVAASNTYRFDSCLRPFPPMYIKNECKDIDALRKAIESIPPLAIVFNELNETDAYENYRTAVELLYWVLVKLREPQIKSTTKMNYDKVMSLAQLEQSTARRTATPPNFIFEISSSKQSTAEQKWKTATEGRSTFYAYHGSRLENFHSIIHYGLQANTRNKSSDKAVCLSSDLTASLPNSPIGYGWGGSILGGGLSCVALCELVDCPDVKKQGTVGRGEPTGDGFLTKLHLVFVKSGGSDSKVHKIPNLISQTNTGIPDVIGIISIISIVSFRNDGSSGLFAWFKQHRLLTFVLGYVVLLASVGLMRDKKLGKFYRLFLNKTSRM